MEFDASSAIVELYDEAGTVRRSGAALRFGDRDVAHASLAFRIVLAPDEERTFWLSQRTNDTVLSRSRMWSEGVVLGGSSRRAAAERPMLRRALGMAVYNLFLFLGTRDRNYLLYVAFQVTNGLTQSALDKYTFQYLWPDHPVWAGALGAGAGLSAMVTAIAFARGIP